MEHIVQFAISMDDKAITDRITDTAEKQIIDSLRKDVVNKLFKSRYYSGQVDPGRDELSRFSEQIFKTFLEENKEVIIDRTVKYLGDKLARSKAGKEILGNVVKDNEA